MLLGRHAAGGATWPHDEPASAHEAFLARLARRRSRCCSADAPADRARTSAASDAAEPDSAPPLKPAFGPMLGESAEGRPVLLGRRAVGCQERAAASPETGASPTSAREAFLARAARQRSRCSGAPRPSLLGRTALKAPERQVLPPSAREAALAHRDHVRERGELLAQAAAEAREAEELAEIGKPVLLGRARMAVEGSLLLNTEGGGERGVATRALQHFLSTRRAAASRTWVGA